MSFLPAWTCLSDSNLQEKAVDCSQNLEQLEGGRHDDSFEARLLVIEEQQSDWRKLLDCQRQEYLDGLAELKESLLALREQDDKAGSKFDLQRSTRSATPTQDSGLPPCVSFSENTQAQGMPTEHEASRSSLWDAALLVFFKELCPGDRMALFLGLLLQLALQAGVLAALVFDMLEESLPDGRLEEMVSWRVNKGHHRSSFDEHLGATEVRRLCNRELWSFQQQQYDEMYDYLYKPFAGWMLSLVTIILWLVSAGSHFRRTFEQALAITSLPELSRECGAPGLVVARDGGVEVAGVRPCARIAALLLLSLPRLSLLLGLSVAGCQFLAHTQSLSQMVVHAAGLAFVLDADQQLLGVFATQRVRALLAGLKPLSCVRKGQECFLMKSLQPPDLLRFVLLLAMVLFTYFSFLEPFHQHLEGAATALCAGGHDFSYSGGEASSAPVVVYDTTGWQASCPSLPRYVSDNYGGSNASASNFTLPPRQDLTDVKRKTVLNYAFAVGGCEEGRFLEPPEPRLQHKETAAVRACRKVPSSLNHVLTTGIWPRGGGPSLPRCAAFKPELGSRACDAPAGRDEEACLWSWQSYQCEGEPPGNFQRQACAAPAQITPAVVREACEMWRLFASSSPLYNCRATEACEGYDQMDCFVLLGRVIIEAHGTGNLNASAVAQTSLLADSVKTALWEVSGIPEGKIFLSDAWDRGQVAGPWTKEVTSIGFEFLFVRCPVTFWEAKFRTPDVGERLTQALKAKMMKTRQTRLGEAVSSVNVGTIGFQTSMELAEKKPRNPELWPWWAEHLAA